MAGFLAADQHQLPYGHLSLFKTGFDPAAQLPAPTEAGSDAYKGQRSWHWLINVLINSLGKDFMPGGSGMGAIPVKPLLGRTTCIGDTSHVVDAPSIYIRKAE